MKNIITWLVLGLLIITLESCEKLSGEDQLKSRTIKVKTEKVLAVKTAEYISYSGTVVAGLSVPLSFSVAGTVEEVLVEEGDVVKKGEPLARILNQSYYDSYNVSLAAQKRAEDAYNRLKPMYEKGNIPEIEFIAVETGYKQATSATSILKKSLEDCLLKSPITGVVGSKSVETGMNVAPGIQSITIINIDKVKIKVPIPENEISKIRLGQKASIILTALNNSEYTGVVDEVGVIAHPFAHTYDIELLVENEKQKLKPGMVCSVNIQNENSNQTIAVHGKAISMDENNNKFVFVIDESNSTAVRRIIKTGRILKNKIEVTEGLKEGETIVISGQHKLSDKTKIETI